jgi:TonB family protein
MRRLSMHSMTTLSVMIATTASAQSAADCAAKFEKAREDILAFYPPAAKAAGVQGMATITCRITPQNARRDCTLVIESPPGQGFGQAALKIASATPDDPDAHLTEDETRRPATMTLIFSLSPPAILPNPLALATVGYPSWRSRPSGDDIALALSKAGVPRNLSGKTSLLCEIADNGRMKACAVTEETPAGAGFGRAAMYLASRFQMSPKTNLGCPSAGTTVDIPIRFISRGD